MPTTTDSILQPDLSAAKRFLRLLDQGAVAFTFQTAHDVAKGEAKRRDLSWHGTLERKRLKPLAERNAERAAVWVMVNQGDGRGRRAENVQRVRAVFADCDGQVSLDQLRRVDPEPHVIVESSPGHFQAYWFCELPLDQFEGVQRAIAQRFGTHHVVDPCRVMRVPGFWHQKDPTRPFKVRIVHECDLPPYQPQRILKAFPPRARAKRTGNGADLDGMPEPAADAERFDDMFPLGDYPSASERDHAVICAMVRQGRSDRRIAAVIRALRDDGKGDRLDYLERSIAKARGEIEAEQDELEELIEQAQDDPGAPFQSICLPPGQPTYHWENSPKLARERSSYA